MISVPNWKTNWCSSYQDCSGPFQGGNHHQGRIDRKGLFSSSLESPRAHTEFGYPRQVESGHLDQLLHPQFADESKYKARVLAKGLPASPGAAVGQIVFTPEEAEEFKAKVTCFYHDFFSCSDSDLLLFHRAEPAFSFALKPRQRTSAGCTRLKVF
jgi:hypothetical protein